MAWVHINGHAIGQAANWKQAEGLVNMVLEDHGRHPPEWGPDNTAEMPDGGFAFKFDAKVNRLAQMRRAR